MFHQPLFTTTTHPFFLRNAFLQKSPPLAYPPPPPPTFKSISGDSKQVQPPEGLLYHRSGGGGGWVAGNSAKKTQPRPEGSCDLVGSPEGDRGIAKLRNLPPRLKLPPSPRSRAASLCSAGSSHPGAQPPRSSTPLGSPPPTGSRENSPGGMGLV